MFFILITYFNFIIILYTHTHIQDINIQYMKSQGKCNFNYKKKKTQNLMCKDASAFVFSNYKEFQFSISIFLS